MPERLTFVAPGAAEVRLREQLDQLGIRERVPFYRTWKGLALPIIAMLALITIDFTRREAYQANGRIISTHGTVTLHSASKGVTYNFAGVMLGEGDVVVTGVNSTAVVWMAGGVTVVLEPNTQFSVRVLDYNSRSRLRDQSFLLRSGRVWGEVPADFSVESRLDVCTPSTVATVHAGARFSLSYDARTRISRLRAIGGNVDFTTAQQRTQVAGGGSALARWYSLGAHEVLTREQLEEARRYENSLAQFEQKPSWVWKLERNVADAMYMPLGLVGIGPKSWIHRSFDTAARSRAMQAMKKLHYHLVDTQTEGAVDFPESVNLITLEELRLSDQERDAILISLAGNRIELYQQYGRGYRLTAFAKDSARTAYEINHKGTIEKIDRRTARTRLQYQGASSNL